MIKVSIVGGTGYTAGELLRILLRHDQVNIESVISTTSVGKRIDSVHRDLLGETDLVYSESFLDPDLIFLCLGHGLSRDFLEKNELPEGCKIKAFQPDQKDSFLSLLPEDTVMWFSDLDHAFERFEYQEANLEEMLENVRTDVAGTSSKDPELVQPTDFEKYQDWKENIQQFQRIEWVERTIEEAKDGDKKSYSFKMQEQPSFNRNFELLIKSLTTLQKDGYQLYIFAENPKQLERLRSIFEDLKASIEFTPIAKALTAGFIDPIAKIAVFTDHQIFQRYHKYKVKQAFSKSKAMSLKALRELQPGDFVAHIDHGIGEYSGLQKIDVNGNVQEAIRILYRDNDVLYVNINSLHKISKYTGKDGTKPRVHKLGGDQWAKLKSKTKRQVKEIATDLIKLYAKRKASEGFAHSPDNYLQTELESSFIFE